MGGLVTAMLLAKDGHAVTVLERDPAPVPGSPDEAWEAWERRGVNQFRMIHLFLPRFRMLARAGAARGRGGARRRRRPALQPRRRRARSRSPAGCRPGDEQFEMLTGRRPVVEAAVAARGEATPASTVRRGVAVAGLLTGARRRGRARPTWSGVVTEDGEELPADLVVDASGRRSPLPRWLAAIGARRPWRSSRTAASSTTAATSARPTARCPPGLGPLLSTYGSISILTLPADNGTWGVGIIAGAGDAAAAGAAPRRPWEAVRQVPARWSPTGSTASRSTTASTSWPRSRTATAASWSTARRWPPASWPSATRGRAPTRRSGAGASMATMHAVVPARPAARAGPRRPAGPGPAVGRGDGGDGRRPGTGRRSRATATGWPRSRPPSGARRTTPTTPPTS